MSCSATSAARARRVPAGASASELGAWDVLLVDDGSEDDTVAVAEARPEAQPGPDGEPPRLAVLRRPHGGKGAAVRAGVLAATGDLVVFADSDMATPPDQLPLLTDALATTTWRWAAGSSPTAPTGGRASRSIDGRWARCSMPWPGPGSRVRCPTRSAASRASGASAGQDLFARQQITSIVFDAEVIHLARKRGYGIAVVPVQWTDQRGSRMRVRPEPRVAGRVGPAPHPHHPSRRPARPTRTRRPGARTVASARPRRTRDRTPAPESRAGTYTASLPMTAPSAP